MECRKYQQWLPFLADCLLSEKQQSQLEKHLATCPACQKEAQTYKTIVDGCCHLPQAEIPCDFYDRLFRRLASECREPEPKTWFWKMPLMAGSLSAAAVLAALIILPPKSMHAPNDLMAGLSPKSQIEKLTPLLDPHPAARSEREAILAKDGQPGKPVARAKKTFSALPMAQSAPPQRSADAPVVAQPAPVMAARQTLLQDADFSQSGQFVPAYTVPHSPEQVRFRSEPLAEAKVLTHLQTGIPVRQKTKTMTVRNGDQLQTLMQKTQQTTPLFTDLDWKKQMLAAVFLNPEECPGYHIQLDAIQQMPEKILIQYRIQRPVSVVPVFESTPPTLFVVLPFSELPVEFQEQ
jgi:anti-sigma factor RsiW